MKVRFQADADLDGSVLRGVKRAAPEIDIRTASDAGLTRLEDTEVLRIAERQRDRGVDQPSGVDSTLTWRCCQTWQLDPDHLNHQQLKMQLSQIRTRTREICDRLFT